MSLNVHLEVLTQPGATGNQTITLAAGFNPKAVRAWAVPAASDGSVTRSSLGVGFGTYRGGVVQQAYAAHRSADAALLVDAAYSSGTDALLALILGSSGGSSRDFELDLVSMDATHVVVNWTNLHSTASIRVFLLILGGAEISDAFAFADAFPTGTTTKDVALPSGFGRPEFVELAGAGGTSHTTSATTPKWWYGFAKQGEPGRGFGYSVLDGDTNVLAAARQRSDRLICQIAAGASATDEALGRLDATVANWPTDGLRILFDANPAAASVFVGLALRTTAQIVTGENVAVAAGSPPVAQDNYCGFAPKLGALLGWNLAASTALQESAGDLIGFGVGAYDGTTEAWCGFTDDDGLGTSDTNSQQSTAKIVQNYSPAAALQSEADAAFAGFNLRLSWNDIDSVAREYQWFAMGDEAAAPPPPDPPATGLARLGRLPFPDVDLQIAFDHDSGAYQACYDTLARALVPAQYLRLQEPSGASAADRGRRLHDAVIHGTVSYHQASPLADPAAYAVALDGSTGYLSANAPELDGASAVTVIAWVKTNGAPANLSRIFEMGDALAGHRWAIVFNGGWVGLDSYNSGDLYGAAAPSSSAWHLIAFVVRPQNVVDMVAVIDGAEVSLEQRIGTPTFTNITFDVQDVYWGASAAATSPLDGSIAEVELVPYAVPVERLKALWEARLEGGIPATDPATFAWTSLRSRLYEASIRRGRNTVLDRMESGQLAAVLENNDRALEPEYDVPGFAPNVLPARPVRMRVGRIYNYARNPSFEADVAGWSGGSSPTRTALGNLHVVQDTAGTSWALTGTADSRAPVIPGQRVYATARMRWTSGTQRTLRLQLVWYDADGAEITSSTVATSLGPGSPISGLWYTLRTGTSAFPTENVAPAGAAYCAARLSITTSIGASTVVQADQVLLYPLGPGESAPTGDAGRSPTEAQVVNYVANPRASRDTAGWGLGASSGTPLLERGLDDGPFGIAYDDWANHFRGTATLAGAGEISLYPTDGVHQALYVETGGDAFLSAYVKASGAVTSITIKARLMDADGAYISATTLQTVSTFLTDWQRIGGHLTVAAGTARVGIEVWFNAAGAGAVVGLATGLQANAGTDFSDYADATIDAYRDGDTAGFAWEGDRHASRALGDFGVAPIGGLYFGYAQSWDLTYPSWRRGEIQLRAVDAVEAFMQDQVATAHPEQLTGGRMHELLDAVGHPLDQRDVAAGTLEVRAIDYSLGPVDGASALGATAEAEGGTFFVDVDGRAVFQDADTRATEQLAATLGDNAAVPYLDLTPDFSLAQIRNVIVAKLAGDVTVSATDAASRRRYRRRLYEFESLLKLADAQTFVDALLARYKDPRLRFTSMTLEPRRDPWRIFPVAVEVGLSRLLHVMRAPPGGGADLERDVFTESVEHRMTMRADEIGWGTRYTLSVDE